MNNIDTIVAISTPHGYSGIGILRVSGYLVSKIAYRLLGKLPYPRKAEYLSFFNKNKFFIDKGIVLFFLTPNSFTGEDILEFQGHGGPVVLDVLFQQVLLQDGVRVAYPGEFLKRSFFNNKLDLIQVESILNLINANSIKIVHLSVNSVLGCFSKYIKKIKKSIVNLRVFIEASINFSNENIDLLSNNHIKLCLNKILFNLNKIINKSYQGYLLHKGIKVVIAGKPNVGKSSLLNAIISRNVAIVTNISGTTRDILRENIYIDGMPIQIIDTTGICDTNNIIEQIGIKLTLHEIKNADHILWVIDNIVNFKYDNLNYLFSELKNKLNRYIPITIICNKADIKNEKIGLKKINNYFLITISALFKKGINILLQYLKQSVGFNNRVNDILLVNKRHLSSLESAYSHLIKAKNNFNYNYPIEFLAEELKVSHELISEITGEFTSEMLLKKIFSDFCIGK